MNYPQVVWYIQHKGKQRRIQTGGNVSPVLPSWELYIASPVNADNNVLIKIPNSESVQLRAIANRTGKFTYTHGMIEHYRKENDNYVVSSEGVSYLTEVNVNTNYAIGQVLFRFILQNATNTAFKLLQRSLIFQVLHDGEWKEIAYTGE